MCDEGLLAVLMLGVVGTGVELFLIEHYEDTLQLVPLATLAIALVVLIWHVVKRDALSIRALQATMVLFLVAGAAGMWFHFGGGAEFQLEIDPYTEPLGHLHEGDARESAAGPRARRHGAIGSSRIGVRISASGPGHRGPFLI